MYAIQTVELTKRYGNVTAVDALNLSVEQGELVSLLGVNGAGKTTAVKLLSCLTRPTSGDAFVGGYSICKDPAAVKSILGVSPQETAIANGLTVRENLELMGGVYGFTKAQRIAKLTELAERFGLHTVLSRKAGKLSGGWKRRLSIAMALVSEPKILYLDEPTLGLDVLARSDLWELIRSLKGKVTVVMTTHYMEEAAALSDRVAIMKDGKLLTCDTVAAIQRMANTNDFEQAFVRLVKGDIR